MAKIYNERIYLRLSPLNAREFREHCLEGLSMKFDNLALRQGLDRLLGEVTSSIEWSRDHSEKYVEVEVQLDPASAIACSYVLTLMEEAF